MFKRLACDLKPGFGVDATHPQSLNGKPQVQKELKNRSFLHSLGSKMCLKFMW